MVDDPLGLLWLVNLGCIDLNPWQSRARAPDEPTHVLFDLDPADGLPFAKVVEAALLVRDALDAVGLRGYPRTSGATGIHILVPVVPGLTFDAVRLFARVVSEALVKARPDLVTTRTKIADRGPRVYLDANQNGRGKSIACVYSVRPRPGAPVATPLRWEEVREGLDPRSFTMGVVARRVEARGRPRGRPPGRPPDAGRRRRAPRRGRGVRGRAVAIALAVAAMAAGAAGCSGSGDGPVATAPEPAPTGTGYFVGGGADGVGASLDMHGSDPVARRDRRRPDRARRRRRGAFPRSGSPRWSTRAPRASRRRASWRCSPTATGAIPIPAAEDVLRPGDGPAARRALRLLAALPRAGARRGGRDVLRRPRRACTPAEVGSVRMVVTPGAPITLPARRR